MFIHLANTDAEFEYANLSQEISFIKSWSRHPLCLQLQYLPLLYGERDDFVAVTSIPSEEYLSELAKIWPHRVPKMILMEGDSVKGMKIQPWGHSRRVKAWANSRGAEYPIPDWDAICLANSKAFSFRYSILKEASLLEHEQDLIRWVELTNGPKVIKTCYGLSGRGNYQLDGTSIKPELLTICRKEWNQGRPIIGEPWLDKISDFSTQWNIHSDGKFELLGVTRFETDPFGNYQGTVAGPENQLFGNKMDLLHQHIEFVQKPLQDIAKMGFFGNIGFDAFLYQKNGITLQPLVEINARKTMSFVALEMQRKYFPDKLFKLSFDRKKPENLSLLPDRCLNEKEKCIFFRHFLTAQVLY